jgi:hypothetical protein
METGRLRTATRWAAAGAIGAAAGYGLLAATAWLRCGHAPQSAADDTDPLLDRFMSHYDIVERHQVSVAAPANLTLLASTEVDLQRSPLIRAIFKGRELMMGAEKDSDIRPRGLLALTRQLGWGLLAETPGREVVMGAVTQPWNANVVFRALPPEEFAAFNEPDYVKIVWTLRAEPITADAAILKTETRAVATDQQARAKFRNYWAAVSPGVALIRWAAVRLVKREAEKRFQRASGSTTETVVPPLAGTSM